MLFNIHTLQWDDNLLKALNIPASMLPEVKSSSEIYGEASLFHDSHSTTSSIPIAGIAGDQQAALFGQLCLQKGMVKNTYGTGCFLLMHTGEQPVTSEHGLLTTIACSINGTVNYALEGSVFMGGACVQWLRDELMLIDHAKETEQLALQVNDTNGVYLVPAFVGLGAPYWDPDARGALTGLTRGSNKNHIVRAALEAIAYQCKDVLYAMEQDARTQITKLRVDGGAVSNAFLMQFQADILDTDVSRPALTETTAAGAAYLAGLAVGFWDNTTQLQQLTTTTETFHSTMPEAQRLQRYNGWKQAVQRIQTKNS